MNNYEVLCSESGQIELINHIGLQEPYLVFKDANGKELGCFDGHNWILTCLLPALYNGLDIVIYEAVSDSSEEICIKLLISHRLEVIKMILIAISKGWFNKDIESIIII